MADDAVGLAGLFGGRRFPAVQPALPALWKHAGHDMESVARAEAKQKQAEDDQKNEESLSDRMHHSLWPTRL